MIHITNKNQLLEWLENNTPRKAITNAMVDGEIELLGAFDPAPGGSNPGWVVKVKSKRGLTWFIIITIHRLKHTYYAWVMPSISWKDYKGGENPIDAGDNPDEYKRLKDK